MFSSFLTGVILVALTGELCTQIPPTVCDFVQRYLTKVEKMQNDPECYRMMKQDKFLILNGSPADIARLTEKDHALLSFYGNSYELTWVREGDTILRVAFPNQFELISGKNKLERDAWLEQRLRSTKPTDEYRIVRPLDETSSFDTEDVSDRVYFDTKGSGAPIPVFEEKRMKESLSNLFLGVIDKEVQCEVTQKNYKEDTHYTISLSQWLTYCAQEHLHLYVGLEKESAVDCTLLFIAESKELGYIHSVLFTVPKDFIRSSHCKVKMSLRGFIPTNNVNSLYN